MQKYNIADMLFGIESQSIENEFVRRYISSQFGAFAFSGKKEPDIIINLNRCSTLEKPEGAIIIDESLTWVRKPEKEPGTFIYICDRSSDTVISVLEVDASWKNAHISYIDSISNSAFKTFMPLVEILFRNCLLRHQGIVIHASAINLQGKGILFSAPSGVGKTTQATLWVRHMGAEILNGDRPAVRLYNRQHYVFGTPWSGSSSEITNATAILRALVILEQSPDNAIYRLSAMQSVKYLLPRCFLPYHDSYLMDLAITTVDALISTVPVYLLKCRPDKSAVELVHQCIK